MTSYKSLDRQHGFADLRQQMRKQLADTMVPVSKIGTLPMHSSN